MNERTRRGGSALFRDLSSAKYLVPTGVPVIEHTEDAAIREALNVVLGWAELLVDDVLDGGTCRRAVSAIERNARVLEALSMEEHLDVLPAVDAALRICEDLRTNGRA